MQYLLVDKCAMFFLLLYFLSFPDNAYLNSLNIRFIYFPNSTFLTPVKFFHASRCEGHGQCKNGTCVCMTGWNGRHCTLPGCPSACSAHGTCVLKRGDWSCQCEANWEGLDCSIRLETECRDGVDNDRGKASYAFTVYWLLTNAIYKYEIIDLETFELSNLTMIVR